MVFPRFILLKSNDNNKFLRYRKEQDSYHALLRFSQDEVDENAEIQYIKFEVQKAKTVEGFVHIRSCYNNKYWVRKSADTNWIVAEASEPEEDQSKMSCTLFKPVLVDVDDDTPVPHDDPPKIRLLHIDQLGQHYTCVSKTQDDYANDLVVGDQDSNSRSLNGSVFTVYNARSVVVLPDYLAFKGNNDRFAAFTGSTRHPVMKFDRTDVGDPGVSNKITQNPILRQVFIQNILAGRFWTLNSPIIQVNSDTANSSLPRTTFRPLRIGGNVIALRSADNNFVNLMTQSINNPIEPTFEGHLGATTSTICENARLQVTEPVRFREITNVNFNLNDSRIYNVNTVQKFKDSRENHTSVDQTGLFKVSYRTSQTTSWNQSVSVTTGIKATWSSGRPFIGERGIEISNERTETREWGVENEEETVVEFEQGLNIPSGKKLDLTVVATIARCDVPFTCTVQDVMTDGTRREYTKTDGLFVGSNEYNIMAYMREGDL